MLDCENLPKILLPFPALGPHWHHLPPPQVPTDITQQQGATLLTHDLFTNNILYFEAALDMRAVPASLLPLVPLFCRSLTQMGTDKESFVELTERIGRKTGGLSVSTMVSSVRGKDEPVAKLMVR
jgi:Zn-dependent M16 (insulinase) family peptidase